MRLPNLSSLGKRKKASLVQAGFSYILQAIGLIQGVILIPLYIQFLGAELYGYWLATGGILFALSLFELGLSQPINQRIAQFYGQGQPQEVSRYFWTGIAIYALLTPLFFIFFLVLAYYVPRLLLVPEQHLDALTFAFIIASISILLKVFNDFLRGFSAAILQPFVPQFSLVLGQMLGLAVIIILLFEGKGVLAIPFGLLVTQYFVFVVSVFFFILGARSKLHLFHWAPTSRHIKEIFLLVPYVMFSRFTMRLTHQLEPTVLTVFVGAEFTTLYAVSSKISEALERAVSVIWGSLFSPFVNFTVGKSIEEIDRLARSILLVLLGSISVLMASYVTIVGPFIRWWLSPEMVAPLTLVTFIALARIFDILGNFMSELHVAVGRIRFTAKYLVFFSAFRFFLLVILAMIFGLFGAPLAAILSGALLSIFFMIAARRRCQLLRYDAQELLVGLGVVVLILVASWGMARVGDLLETDVQRFGLAISFGGGLFAIFLFVLRRHLHNRRTS